MAVMQLQRSLAALAAVVALAAAPAGAQAGGPAGPASGQSGQETTSGHDGDPSGPRPDDAGDPGAPAQAPAGPAAQPPAGAPQAVPPAPAPDGGVSPDATAGSTVGVTHAPAGETFDVVASARPAPVSRRDFTIRIARGIHVAAARVWVDGRPAPVHRGRRTTARIDLRGTPRRRVTVRIRIRTREGAVIEATRTYETCTAHQPGGTPSV